MKDDVKNYTIIELDDYMIGYKDTLEEFEFEVVDIKGTLTPVK